ncbi:hypothetical protein FB451DRAFT_1370337 [Mycena latifolia]|nr:hypothetical protein FB451DRAFT_1370337 [Mycena latifolia]
MAHREPSAVPTFGRAQIKSSDAMEIDSDATQKKIAETGVGQPTLLTATGNSSASVDIRGQAETFTTSFESIKDLKQKGLESLLNDGLKFEGTFACFERYPANGAPNPFLRIDGLGAIGIPLSAREAAVILASGVSEKTQAAYPSKRRWELGDAKAEWEAWIRKTAGPASLKILAGKTFVEPIYKLRKLILQEPGSQTEGSEDRIGTLVVLLPSTYDGAQLQLRHVDDTLLVDLSHHSGISTSVIAAYSGVGSELAPISSGYRLSISYDILQPITHPESKRSGLPDMQRIHTRLKQILTSWMDTPDTKLCALHWLLKGKYDRGPDFSRRSLTGSDTHLVAHLDPLARELGFQLHFAHVELVITASDTVEEEYYDGRFHFNMEDEDGELSVIQIVDLEGMPLLATGLNFLATDLINGCITEYDPDLSDFDREDDTTASCTNTYRRVVLLISKDDTGFSPNINEIYDYASITLQESRSLTPSDREMILVDNLLQLSETTCDAQQLRTVAHLLAESADRWNNLPILLRALKACRVDRRIDLVGADALISMYQAFGFDALKNFYEDALKNDETNLARQGFLTGLLEMAREEGSTEIIAWCETQHEEVLRNLRVFDLKQLEWLFGVAKARGGEFLRDVIFPQLQTQALETPFWITLMRRLQKTSSTWSPELIGTLILLCVAKAVEALPAFPTVTNPGPYSKREADTASIMEVVRICAETGNSHFCDRISGRMRETARARTSRPPSWIFYAKLAVSLNDYLRTSHIVETPVYLKPFFSDAVDSLLSAGQDATFNDCTMSVENLTVIKMAIKRAGGMAFLKARLKADYWKIRTSAELQAFIRSLRAEFMPPAGDIAAESEFRDVTSALVDATIHAFNMSALIPKKPTLSYSDILRSILDLVKFCFQVDAPKSQVLLLKLLQPPPGYTIPQHLDKVLVPLIPVLKTFLATVHLDYRTEPFKTFYMAVIKSYANTMIGRKPHELVAAAELEGVGCSTCAECAALKAFFAGDQSSIDFSRAQAKRSHLEHQLAATTPWGVTWETHRTGSPHTLRIKKPVRMTTVDLAKSTEKGLSLIAELGDSAMQRLILGADHDWILAKIAPPKKANQPSTGQKRSGSEGQPVRGHAAKKARTS